MLVGDISTNNARRYPNKRALIDADRVHTWGQVDERACRLAWHLQRRDLDPGDRVLVIARNCIEWPEISFGLAKAGLIAVPVNIRLAPDELAHVRNDAGACAAIVHADQFNRFSAERARYRCRAGGQRCRLRVGTGSGDTLRRSP
jgi:acyl-CoA synthetase (AMP-forming)/AMP-acid ligase II